jgi:hypothetical protein
MTKNVFFGVLICLLVSPKPSHSQDLSAGLVAYYPFSGNTNDASGNGHNVVFNNATLTADRFGNPNAAYLFNGVDNYMKILNDPAFYNEQMSLCAVVKPLGFYDGNCYNNAIIDKGTPDFLAGNFTLRFTNGAYTLSCSDPDTMHQNFTGFAGPNPGADVHSPFVRTQTWYCVVYTVSADSLRIYIDGNLSWGVLRPSAIGTNTQDIYLGRKFNDQFPYWFNGVMDEVRFYNRAITQTEVSLLCSMGGPVPLKLTDFYTTVIDNKKISITWKTEEESGIKNYTVERAVSGSADFIEVNNVTPKNINAAHSYSVIDNSARPNVLYDYRLAIKDNDGTKKYSRIKTAKINNHLFYTSVYPNPTTGIVKLNVNNADAAISVSVVNTIGQVVQTKKINSAPSAETNIDLSGESKGAYWIIVETGSAREIKQVILQ